MHLQPSYQNRGPCGKKGYRRCPVGTERQLNRRRAVWTASYVYLAYVFLGEAPVLSKLPAFSLTGAFVVLVVLYLASSYVSWGAGRATRFILCASLVSYTMEFVGVETGAPFGHYSYTHAMGPMLGPVPLAIPFIWAALGYFCLEAAGPSVLAPALLMTVLDVSFDPLFSVNLWRWAATPGPHYFGVPVVNFVGWFLTSVLIFAVFRLAGGRGGRSARELVCSRGSREAVAFYLLFGMTNVVYLLESSLGEAALVSAALYAVLAAALWSRAPRAGGAPMEPTSLS